MTNFNCCDHFLPLSSGELEILAVVIYGWTGDDGNPEAAERTDEQLQASLAELETHRTEMKMLIGDFNADPDKEYYQQVMNLCDEYN